MAILQSDFKEIRYLKRSHLEEEAKIIGGYYRDIIRQYGIDCNYYKIKVPYMEQFKKTIDENNILLHAYGEDPHPDYSLSADMITFMQVDDDVLNLNRFGNLPNMDVNFYFDTKDFACSLMSKLGRLKEYKIKEQDFVVEVPEIISDYVEYDSDYDGIISEDEIHYLSNEVFPFGIGYGVPEFYDADILSGKFAVQIGPYEVDKEYTVMCHPYEHGDLNISFPQNDTIYQSFYHRVRNDDFIDQILFLTYKVKKIKVYDEYRYFLVGKLHGAVLFRDIIKMGKYLDQIHPDVGDIITIDFPDENNRQQFEITDCTDKQLTNDGINPLLHKYVWKCKARRYINSGEDVPEHNEANERLDESLEFLNSSDEDVNRKLGMYDEEYNDAIYGGYERDNTGSYDKKKVDILDEKTKFDFIDDGSYINLHTFMDDTKLITDGYELFYVDSQKKCYQMTMVEDEHIINQNLVASGIQYIKSTDDALFFVNFDNKVQKICEDDNITQGEIQNCLNSLLDTTFAISDTNNDGDFYFKFNNSKTILMSLNDHLYCRFGNKSAKMIKLI